MCFSFFSLSCCCRASTHLRITDLHLQTGFLLKNSRGYSKETCPISCPSCPSALWLHFSDGSFHWFLYLSQFPGSRLCCQSVTAILLSPRGDYRMSLTAYLLQPSCSSSSSSSSVVEISQHKMILLLLLLVPPLPNLVMTSSLLAVAHQGDRASANKVCHRLEMPDGGVTVHCSGRRLTQVPIGLSNLTIRLHLDKNLLRYLPADSFSNLFLLTELDLSHNQISFLEAGCFRGLASSLHFLDLSSNQLSALDPAVLGDLGALANLTHNPWHCDCNMQLSLPLLDLDPESLAHVICQSSDIPNLGTIGIPVVVLVEDWDLCLSVRRTIDVVMLATMFLWFFMLFSYLFYYIHQNQEHARRHMEYLKSLQSRQV